MAESIQKGREVFKIPGSTPNCGNDFKNGGKCFLNGKSHDLHVGQKRIYRKYRKYPYYAKV